MPNQNEDNRGLAGKGAMEQIWHYERLILEKNATIAERDETIAELRKDVSTMLVTGEHKMLSLVAWVVVGGIGGFLLRGLL